MAWAHYIRETWDDMPVAAESGPMVGNPSMFGGGQWLVVALPPTGDIAGEAIRDARAMGVRVSGLVFRDDLELDLILADLPSGDSLVPAALDDSSATRWAMEVGELLKSEPVVRQVLLLGESEPMSSALDREFPLASHYRLNAKEAADPAEVLAVLCHTPRCC